MKKGMSLLFALAMVFMQGNTIKALNLNAIGSEMNQEEQEYTPHNIKSIFNMTEGESNKIVKRRDINIMSINYNGEEFFLPVISNVRTIVQKYDESLIYNFEDQVQIEDVKDFFQQEFSIDLETTNRESYQEFRDIISDRVIAVFDIGEILPSKSFKSDLIGKNDLSIVEITSSWFLPDFFELIIGKPEVYESLKKQITLGEFLEIYKREVPEPYWPVRFNIEKNENSTLPKFSEEFLNKPASIINDFNIICFLDDNKNIIKIIIEDAVETHDIDYITGETVKFKNGSEYERNYLTNIGVKKVYDTTYFWPYIMYHEPFSYDFLKYPEILKMVHKFFQAKTNRDLIEAYQYLPSKYQVDYSYFDFSKNPDVAPAWLAIRPSPPPTPTPPPYLELTLGSRGQEVLDMKGRFYELGYFRTDTYNDQYSQNTADTVKQFEKNNGLPVDGVADAVMLSVLFSDSAVGK